MPFTPGDPGVHGPDFGVHDADPGVHDGRFSRSRCRSRRSHAADLGVHARPIFAFTLGRRAQMSGQVAKIVSKPEDEDDAVQKGAAEIVVACLRRLRRAAGK
ncbi:MAG: hypothetical protein IT348_18740 [Candidatus Eisenbacteria bacterium]|nr:hypothetical protein [Candidatus Eisenbacteria bacterium]